MEIVQQFQDVLISEESHLKGLITQILEKLPISKECLWNSSKKFYEFYAVQNVGSKFYPQNSVGVAPYSNGSVNGVTSMYQRN